MVYLRFIFHRTSMLLLVSLFYLWASIGLFHDSHLENEDLILHSGRVIYIDSINTKHAFLLRIAVDSEPSTVFTTTPLKKHSHFHFITSKVGLGDKITIFTKPRLWKIFGLKRGNDISRLIKDKEIIVSYERFKQKARGLFLFTAVASIGFLLAYIFVTRKRIKDTQRLNHHSPSSATQ